MKFKVEGCASADLVKRAMYMAWTACGGPAGMGFLQDRGAQTEDQVWEAMYNKTDYPCAFDKNQPGKVYADYVLGRMMKVGFKWEGDTVEITGSSQWRRDYQAFCVHFPTARDLLNAAAESLGGKVSPL